MFRKIRFTDAANIAWRAALFGNAPGYPNSASFGVRGTSVTCGTLNDLEIAQLGKGF